jgi:acetyl-CoA carboxylase beta subunit
MITLSSSLTLLVSFALSNPNASLGLLPPRTIEQNYRTGGRWEYGVEDV